MGVCAGIVLFNPDISGLIQNIASIAPQVEELILVDNTPGGFDVNIETHLNVRIVHNFENLGIGKALNQILDFAKSRGYDWFITIDQDSICDANLVENYKKYLDDSIGQITCNIQDRSLGEIDKQTGNNSQNDSLKDVEGCITSGCINNTEAIIKVGGYDETLFIDGVDIDISLRLRQYGYRVTRLDYDGLMHSLGDGKKISVLGKKMSLTRHAPWRSYYMRRNFIYIARQYYSGTKKYKAILKQIIYGFGTVLLEDEKLERIKYNVQGIMEGFRVPLHRTKDIQL